MPFLVSALENIKEGLKMEIEHKLIDTQVQYGFIWWKTKRENEKYRRVFPVGEFTLDLEGEKCTKRVVWNRGRVSIGRKTMQTHFQQDDIILISKSSDGTVLVRKKPCGERAEGGAVNIFKCESCRFFREIGVYQKMSQCHRNPPAFTSFDKTRDAFPRVSKGNFCGEYKPKETNSPTRVYILARELDVKSSVIIEKCQEHNFEIKNHKSLASPGLAGLIREWFSKPK